MVKRINWTQLQSPQSSWAFIAPCTESDMDGAVNLDPVSYRNIPEGAVVRFIRAVHCQNWLDFLRYWAAAFQFPWYFGYNVDAFAECARDLSWLKGSFYLIVITNANLLLRNVTDESFGTLIKVLEVIAMDWQESDNISEDMDPFWYKQATPFRVVFNVNPDDTDELLRRFAAIRYTFPEIDMSAE